MSSQRRSQRIADNQKATPVKLQVEQTVLRKNTTTPKPKNKTNQSQLIKLCSQSQWIEMSGKNSKLKSQLLFGNAGKENKITNSPISERKSEPKKALRNSVNDEQSPSRIFSSGWKDVDGDITAFVQNLTPITQQFIASNMCTTKQPPKGKTPRRKPANKKGTKSTAISTAEEYFTEMELFQKNFKTKMQPKNKKEDIYEFKISENMIKSVPSFSYAKNARTQINVNGKTAASASKKVVKRLDNSYVISLNNNSQQSVMKTQKNVTKTGQSSNRYILLDTGDMKKQSLNNLKQLLSTFTVSDGLNTNAGTPKSKKRSTVTAVNFSNVSEQCNNFEKDGILPDSDETIFHGGVAVSHRDYETFCSQISGESMPTNSSGMKQKNKQTPLHSEHHESPDSWHDAITSSPVLFSNSDSTDNTNQSFHSVSEISTGNSEEPKEEFVNFQEIRKNSIEKRLSLPYGRILSQSRTPQKRYAIQCKINISPSKMIKRPSAENEKNAFSVNQYQRRRSLGSISSPHLFNPYTIRVPVRRHSFYEGTCTDHRGQNFFTKWSSALSKIQTPRVEEEDIDCSAKADMCDDLIDCLGGLKLSNKPNKSIDELCTLCEKWVITEKEAAQVSERNNCKNYLLMEMAEELRRDEFGKFRMDYSVRGQQFLESQLNNILLFGNVDMKVILPVETISQKVPRFLYSSGHDYLG